MNVSASLSRLVPSLNGPRNAIRDMWDRVHGLPGGPRIFSRLVGMAAPYTGTIGAQVVELEQGYARVVLRDRRAVRNHLESIHAVALVNLAELTGNVALAYSLPDDARFIVAGIEIEYLKKARGPITGTCQCPVPDSSERQELAVPVEMRDDAGDLVARATLRSLVGPKKRSAA